MKNLQPTIGFITVVLACILSSHVLNATDVRNLCNGKLSCYRNSAFSFTERRCECDLYCPFYNDCCLDANVPYTPHRFINASVSCMAFGQQLNMGAYVVDSCPDNFDVVLRRKCEYKDFISDPMQSVPVTDITTGVTYRRQYCAECNGARLDSLQSWLIVLNCTLYPLLYDVEANVAWRHLKYEEGLKTWGIDFRGEFHECKISFDKPSNLKLNRRRTVRLCRSGVVSTCPESWKDMSVARDCESYAGVLYTLDGKAYKNNDCARCNGVLEGLRCGTKDYRHVEFTYDLVWDASRNNKDIVGEDHVCPPDRIYDPFFMYCRNLVCKTAGYKIADGKCIAQISRKSRNGRQKMQME